MAPDMTGFEAAVLPHYPRLVARLALVVRDADEAQDLAQETMLRAWRAWPTLRPEEVGAWLHVVGLRLAISELRRRRRWGFLPLLDGRSIEASATSDPALWEALGRLGRSERAAIVLHVLEGFTYDEIAERLKVPPGTVASWLSRGKAHLRGFLTDETGRLEVS